MRRTIFRIAAAAIAVLFFSAAACFANEDYNLVIIVINALRPDYLGCYGAKQKNTPNIDSLAAEGTRFDNAIGQSYWTLPSMVSLLTGKYVSSHGVNSRNTRISDQDKTLAEILKEQGFNTSAFTCGLDTINKYGLEKGFDRYSYYTGPKPVGSLGDIIPEISAWLDKNRHSRFFALIHSYDLHPPYDKSLLAGAPDRDYNGIFAGSALDYGILKKIQGNILNIDGRQLRLEARDFAYIKELYASGIKRVDAYVGEIISELKKTRVYDKSIIILCADHGEELGERGTYDRFDNQNLYQEVIHVPLIIRYPLKNVFKQRVSAQAGLIDLMPTLLDLLRANYPPDADIDGISLIQLMRGTGPGANRKFLIAQGQKHKWALLRPDGWKLIFMKGEERLYNVKTDPGERKDLAAENKQLTTSMLKDFLNWYQLRKKDVNNGSYVTLDAEMVENLKKAGYW
jgi:arylsulfatase